MNSIQHHINVHMNSSVVGSVMLCLKISLNAVEKDTPLQFLSFRDNERTPLFDGDSYVEIYSFPNLSTHRLNTLKHTQSILPEADRIGFGFELINNIVCLVIYRKGPMLDKQRIFTTL